MNKAADKISLVTGGNRGIGLGIVKGLAAEGHTVLMGSRNNKEGEKIAESLKDIGKIEVIQLDVTDLMSVVKAATYIAERYKKLDVLINNAGIISEGRSSLSEGNVKTIKSVFEVNYFGPIRMYGRFVPLLQKSSDARIINVSSGMGALDDLVGGYAAYRLSKAGLNAQTIQLAHELADSHIKVVAMCPGWVRTDMGGQDAPRSVEEGADTAVWLATSDEAESGKFYRNRKQISW